MALTSISILLGIILLSCVFDAYGMRLRSRICNIYYPDRAHDRAIYLHDRIKRGRTSRRIQLHSIILHKCRKRKLTLKFSWVYRFFNFFQKRKVGKPRCFGCLSVVILQDNLISVDMKDNDGSNLQCTICKNCLKDFKC